MPSKPEWCVDCSHRADVHGSVRPGFCEGQGNPIDKYGRCYCRLYGPDPREFGPCVKCGGQTVVVRHHAGKTHCSECRTVESCKYSHACGEDGTKGEHLVARCDRCGWSWKEKVSDAAS